MDLLKLAAVLLAQLGLLGWLFHPLADSLCKVAAPRRHKLRPNLGDEGVHESEEEHELNPLVQVVDKA